MYIWGIHPTNKKPWRFRDGKPISEEEMSARTAEWVEIKEKICAKVYNDALKAMEAAENANK